MPERIPRQQMRLTEARCQQCGCPARYGANHPLRGAGIADCLAGRIAAGRYGGIRNDPASPDGCDQIALADDAITVAEKVDQQVEHRRIERNRHVAMAQFAPVGIEHTISEREGRHCSEKPPSQARLKEKTSSS